MLDCALKTDKLNLYYGAFHGLKDVDFCVYRNAITSLIGPSGCGKSTLLRCFNRMNDLIDDVAVQGTILVNDEPLAGIDIIELRKKIGMVFQRPNPFPFTVRENLVYGLKVHGYNKRRYDEILERCLKAVGLWEDIKDKLNTPAMSLSEEMKQRLCVARVLTVEPEIILLDEPCSALDPIATLKIEELMIELKRNYTILIVTHNMQQAARVSDYTGFMLLGDLIEFGETSKIFTSPADERTDGYITGRFG
ncbi:MAG: phosphate ABC transporter ATP-binding protein [Deltaproteobacteria bacterium]|nr:phosphate ABC transporter ATP-binding protein [Deltaproteobacteria bacterium]